MKTLLSLFATLFLALLVSFEAQSQYGDCFTPAPLTSLGSGCTSYSYPVTPSGFGTVNELAGNNFSNPTTNPNCCNAGCLLAGELNSTWITFTVTTGGLLEFSIGAGATTPGCIDWAMWEYDSNACANIANNTLAPVACNWNAPCVGMTGMASTGNLPAGGNWGAFEQALTVSAGDQFVICVSNYSGQSTTFPFNVNGTAQVNCGASDITICEGDTGLVLANAPPGTGIAWLPDPTLTLIGTGDSALVFPTVTTDYYVDLIDTNGITTQDTATVTVIPTIYPTITVTPDHCDSTPGGVIDISIVGGGTGTINYGIVGPVITSNTTGIFYNLPQGIYNVSIEPAAHPQCAVSQLVEVGFNCNLQDWTICEGDTVMINIQGYPTHTKTWQSHPDMIISATADTAWVFPDTTTLFILELEDTNGVILYDTSVITVIPTIVPTTVTTPQACTNVPDGSIVITTTGGSQPLNYVINGPVMDFNNTGVFTGLPAGVYTINIFPFNHPSCSITYTDSIEYIPPAVVYWTGDTSICFGDSTTLYLHGTDGYSIQWSTGDTTTSLDVYSLTDTTISVTIDNGCETWNFSPTVLVHPLPNISAGPDTTIAVETSVVLDGSGGVSYVWNPPTGLDCFTCEDPVASPVVNTIYTLTGMDANGCINTDWMYVEVEYLPLFIPTAFSPNGDDINEILYVRGAGITSLNLIVYDRWGTLIFQSQSRDKGWDGTFNGKPAEAGVYTYQLSATRGNGDLVEMKGNVTLFR